MRTAAAKGEDFLTLRRRRGPLCLRGRSALSSWLPRTSLECLAEAEEENRASEAPRLPPPRRRFPRVPGGAGCSGPSPWPRFRFGLGFLSEAERAFGLGNAVSH